jgi:hypothetical protein
MRGTPLGVAVVLGVALGACAFCGCPQSASEGGSAQAVASLSANMAPTAASQPEWSAIQPDAAAPVPGRASASGAWSGAR